MRLLLLLAVLAFAQAFTQQLPQYKISGTLVTDDSKGERIQ
jgi:hypothetical protein